MTAGNGSSVGPDGKTGDGGQSGANGSAMVLVVRWGVLVAVGVAILGGL